MEKIIGNAYRVFDTTPVVGVEKMREVVAAADGLMLLYNTLAAIPKPEPDQKQEEPEEKEEANGR